MHDNANGKGVPLGSSRVHTLGYADDLALTDDGDADGINMATERATAIGSGSRNRADMNVKIVKTKILHVRAQDPVTDTSTNEATAVSKFVCPHLNCGFRFFTKRGMQAHAGRCEWRNEFEIERILAHRGPVHARQYLVRWKNYDTDLKMTRGFQGRISTLKLLGISKLRTTTTTTVGPADAQYVTYRAKTPEA